MKHSVMSRHSLTGLNTECRRVVLILRTNKRNHDTHKECKKLADEREASKRVQAIRAVGAESDVEQQENEADYRTACQLGWSPTAGERCRQSS